MRLVWGTVEARGEPEGAARRLTVRLDGDAAPSQAVLYTTLVGDCAPGDRVLCNTTAVDLSLGTGGEHFVVARAGEGVSFAHQVPGHIMKLRYTPLQHNVTAVEEDASGFHEVMADAASIDGTPVVCCGLHSQISLVAAAVKESAPDLRVVYVMSDEAALPLAVSRLVPQLRAKGLLDGTVTCGQAFGGELEAVNLYSGILAARHVLHADVIVVAIGPGIPGTATRFGHSGIAQGQALNAACSLGGVPIAVLRLSFADPRPRHVPVSHQTLTALSAVALCRVLVPVPTMGGQEGARIDQALETAGLWLKHERRSMAPRALPDVRGVETRTMGRTATDDPAFFHASAAAGQLAAQKAIRSQGMPTSINE